MRLCFGLGRQRLMSIFLKGRLLREVQSSTIVQKGLEKNLGATSLRQHASLLADRHQC